MPLILLPFSLFCSSEVAKIQPGKEVSLLEFAQHKKVYCYDSTILATLKYVLYSYLDVVNESVIFLLVSYE